MKHKAKKGLRNAFAKAAAVATVALAGFGCASMNNARDFDSDKDRNTISYNQTTLDDEWDELNNTWSYDYDYDGQDSSHLPDGQHTITIMLESSNADFEGLALIKGSNPTDILKRHGEAGAYIIDEYADLYSGYDIDVRFIEPVDNIVTSFFLTDSEQLHAFMDNADIVGLSTVFITLPSGISPGPMDTFIEIDQADQLWMDSDMIFVWSAGNGGRASSPDIERPAAFHAMRADTMVRIGEVMTDRNGEVRIADHSSRGGVSFMTRNPYTDPGMALSYPYIRDSQDFRDRADQLYQHDDPFYKRSGEEIFEDQLILRKYDPTLSPDVKDAHPLIFSPSIDFPGKDDLMKDRQWQRDNPDRVRQAYMNALEAAIPYLQSVYRADANGNVTNIPGTSFSQPYAAAMLSAGHELYPELSEFEIIAAALIASEPVVKTQGNGIFASRPVIYTNNGRNMLYNNEAGGFGLLEAERYLEVLGEMADMLDSDPALSVSQAYAESDLVKPPHNPVFYNDANGQKVQLNSYNIEIDEDIIAMRTNLSLSFTGDHNNVPHTIKLINPAGESIEISPTNPFGSRAEYSMATTDGHFGNATKGTWRVEFEGDFEMDKAHLVIHGSDRGGLIDQYLEQTVDQQNVPDMVGHDVDHSPDWSSLTFESFDTLNADPESNTINPNTLPETFNNSMIGPYTAPENDSDTQDVPEDLPDQDIDNLHGPYYHEPKNNSNAPRP